MSLNETLRISEQSVVAGNMEIIFSRLDDEFLAIDERSGYCYSLNVSASRIWDLISTPTAVESICSVLCNDFEVDPVTCRRDVSEVLNVMLEAGLIRVLTNATTG